MAEKNYSERQSMVSGKGKTGIVSLVYAPERPGWACIAIMKHGKAEDVMAICPLPFEGIRHVARFLIEQCDRLEEEYDSMDGEP